MFESPLGAVGEIRIAAHVETVVAYTPFEEMKHCAQHLYDTHRDAIEAAIS